MFTSVAKASLLLPQQPRLPSLLLFEQCTIQSLTKQRNRPDTSPVAGCRQHTQIEPHGGGVIHPPSRSQSHESLSESLDEAVAQGRGDCLVSRVDVQLFEDVLDMRTRRMR